MMLFISLLIILLNISIKNSQEIYRCDFDYGQICFTNILTNSFILLNETSDKPLQPVSDVTSIQTSNEFGECYFPYKYNSFDLFFCLKTDINLPSTCPIFNETGAKINCSEGEYGYELFDVGEIGSRSYKLNINKLNLGEHCIRFYYYLSNNYSNSSIEIIIENNQLNVNQTIVKVKSTLENKWNQIRANFFIENENPTIYFKFQRELSIDSNPFYIGIDDITIIDLPCEPITTTATTTTVSTSIQTSKLTTMSTMNITTSENIHITSLSTSLIVTNLSRTSQIVTSSTSSTIELTSILTTNRTENSLSSSQTTTTNSSNTIQLNSSIIQIQSILLVIFLIKILVLIN